MIKIIFHDDLINIIQMNQNSIILKLWALGNQINYLSPNSLKPEGTDHQSVLCFSNIFSTCLGTVISVNYFLAVFPRRRPSITFFSTSWDQYHLFLIFTKI